MNILVLLLGYLFGDSSRDDTPYHHSFHKHMTRHKNDDE